MASAASPAVRRILQDLKELKEHPIVGANAEPFGDNLMKWYGIVVGMEGTPYANIPIRFQLEFPDNYPNEAPSAYFDTRVPYEGGAEYNDASGRQVVCLNIFGNFGRIHDEWANMSEGWTPSYSISTILLSMQSLMISDMLSKHPNHILAMEKAAKEFKCSVTKHDGSRPSKWFPRVFATQEEVDKVLEQHKRGPFQPLRDHYVCYVKKTSAMGSAILGYGIHVDNPKILTLSSPCEYISSEAFKDGTRRGSTNRAFEYWFPILIHSQDWLNVKPLLLKAIKDIGEANPNNLKLPLHEQVFKICSSIMNSLVVEIMNNKGNLTANDKFIDGYFAFYRILLEVGRVDPKLIPFADTSLASFIQFPNARSKTSVANLGELLIFLAISKKYNWTQLAAPFIDECDARNVFWYAVGNNQNRAKHPELVNPTVVTGRAVKVFKAAEVSRNLVMFQVRFSQVAKSLSRDDFDVNFGRAPEKLREEVKDLYTLVSTVHNWDAYFDWLGMPQIGEKKRDEQLVGALKLSAARRYHGGGGGGYSGGGRGRGRY